MIEWLVFYTSDAVCSQCQKIPKEGLKRCGKCHVTLYCSKLLHVKWKMILEAAVIEWLVFYLSDAVCSQCQQIPKEGLKRCGKCHVTLYCSKECQRRHWTYGAHRNYCQGNVVSR